MADQRDGGIAWTEQTWNPIRGCSLVSAGCTNCYAMRQAHRFSGVGRAYEGLTRLTSNGPVWTGEVRLVEDKMDEPLRWKRPRRVFVNSMSDLFHESLPDEAIDRVFAVMAICPQHTFQVLTKRAERMQRYLSTEDRVERIAVSSAQLDRAAERGIATPTVTRAAMLRETWPLSRIHLGVSIEDQPTADERIPWLLKTPAAVRWVSYEPALGPVNLRRIREYDWHVDALTGERVFPEARRSCYSSLSWVVCGGESGPGARPFDVQWARDTITQCKAARISCFVKQLGRVVHADPREFPTSRILRAPAGGQWAGYLVELKDKKGGDWNEWPEDLQVRQWP